MYSHHIIHIHTHIYTYSKSLANYAYKEKLKKCEDYIKKFKSVIDAFLTSRDNFVSNCENVEGDLQYILIEGQRNEELLTLRSNQVVSSMKGMEV